MFRSKQKILSLFEVTRLRLSFGEITVKRRKKVGDKYSFVFFMKQLMNLKY